jgi:hypothetical protein
MNKEIFMKNLQKTLMLLTLALLFAGSVRAQETEAVPESVEMAVYMNYGYNYYSYLCSYPANVTDTSLFYVEAFNPSENIMYAILFNEEKEAINFVAGYTGLCQLLKPEAMSGETLNSITEYLGKWFTLYFDTHYYEEIDWWYTKDAGIFTYIKMLRVG